MPDDSPSKQLRIETDSNRVVLLIVACAVIALAFTFAGGAFMFMTARHFDSDSEWLDHTHAVIEPLQLQAARLDRVDYNMQLFKASGDDSHRRYAESAILQLNTGLLRIQDLVKDNASQRRHVEDLERSLRRLSDAVWAEQPSQAGLDRQLLDCRAAVNLMQNEEHSLLEQRTAESQRTLIRGYFRGIGYIVLSLAVLLVVFGVLIREALKRKAFEMRLELANGGLASSVAELGQRVDEAALVKSARDELQLCTNADQSYKCAARHFEKMMPGSGGLVMIMTNSRSSLMTASRWGDPAEMLDNFEADACCGLRAGRTRWRRSGDSDIHCDHFRGTHPENYICIPLSALGDTMGFLFIDLPDEDVARMAETRLVILCELLELVAMTSAGLNLRDRLESQSIRDSLTGLFNRHFMEIALERELQRAARQGTPVALLMLDIDHFKTFNDSYGHEAGDLILREVAACLHTSVRGEDIVCRYGGEEFVMILPELSETMALIRAESIRESVSLVQAQFRGTLLRHVSISVGVSMYPATAMSVVELLRVADQGLYQAKGAGRNQVKMFGAVPNDGIATAAPLPN